MPRVVVRRGRHKPSAVRREGHHRATSFPDVIDDLHGTHVVDARIQPHFVQDKHALRFGTGVQGLHVVGHVTGRQHMNTCLNGHTRHLRMHEGWEHADDQICRRNAGVSVRGVRRRHLKRVPTRVAFDFGYCRRQIQVAHMNLPPLSL